MNLKQNENMETMKVHSTCLRNKNLKNVPCDIPMELLNEEQAQINHGQSLKRLNERGGLGIAEILSNIKKDKSIYREEETQEMVDELNEIVINSQY